MSGKIRLGALLSGVGLAVSAWACQVPVFRYALERWYPDPYRLTVTPGKSGALSADESAVLEALTLAAEPEAMWSNLMVAQPEKGETEAAAARLELRYPQKYWGQEMPAVWSGELTRENARRILESPLRRELAKRLLAGQSVVWVLVESGEPELDGKAEETLLAACAEVKEEFQIPEGVVSRDSIERGEAGFPMDPEDLLQAAVPLKIDFSVLRLSRSDPEEEVFLAMLLQLEEDLAALKGEPMAFPVFGRARVLEPLVGAGIHRDNVLDWLAYLCGACSCQVKEQNPGMDLLVSANWEEVLAGNEVVIEKVLPPLEGVAALLAEPAPPQSGEAAEASARKEGSRSMRFPAILAAALGAALLAIALATVVLLLRANRRR